MRPKITRELYATEDYPPSNTIIVIPLNSYNGSEIIRLIYIDGTPHTIGHVVQTD